MHDGITRRNFVKYAGAATAAGGLAGQAAADSATSSNLTAQEDGERPLQWIGPDWAIQDGQVERFVEMTDIETNATRVTIPTAQQRVLGGERETLDVLSLDTSGIGAMIEHEAHYPLETADLDAWDEDTISELFTDPASRLEHLGAQTDTILDTLWEDEERTTLRFPPYNYNFDAMGYNPQFVDDVSQWSALFDEQYEGEAIIGETAAITIPQAMMHLLDNDMIDGEIGDLNNPTTDQLDTAIDFLIEQKAAGQFRTTWEGYGESVTVMAAEEAVIGDLWQPAAMDVRREGTPCTYATMEEGIQGYRFWYGGMTPLNPGAVNRNNLEEVITLLNDVHWGAWFPRYIQGWGYSVPHYPNTDLVRDGSDESGDGMGPEYYDWAYEGEATYEPVDEPALFDPQEYDWSDEEGDPDEDGSVRDSGPIEERIDRIGFFQIWPDNAEHMTDRWRDFLAA